MLDKLFREAKRRDELLVTLVTAAFDKKPRTLANFFSRQDVFEQMLFNMAEQAVDSAVGKASDWAMDALRESVFADVADDLVDTRITTQPSDPVGAALEIPGKLDDALKRLTSKLPPSRQLRTAAVQEYASMQAFVQEQVKRVAARAVGKAAALGSEQLRAIGKDAARKLYEAAASAALEKTKSISFTAISSFQRGFVQRATASRGAPSESERYWIYIGPDDRVTRPFCEALAGKAIPDRLLDRLANGQGLPVRRFCGGYNCRHTLVPVSERYVAANEIEEITSSEVNAINALGRQR